MRNSYLSGQCEVPADSEKTTIVYWRVTTVDSWHVIINLWDNGNVTSHSTPRDRRSSRKFDQGLGLGLG